MSVLSVVIELITKLFTQLTSPPPRQVVQSSDGDAFDEQDTWYDWQGIEPAEFWRRIFDIEAAGSDSVEAQDARAREHGLPGMRGYARVKGTFLRHFEHDHAFMQAMVTARQGEMQGWMDDAASQGNLLEPIDGVSCETWATIAATLTTLGDDPDGYHRVLAEHGLDAEQFEAAQAAWTLRMQSAADPMGAAAISQVYGKAFTDVRSAGQSAMSDTEPCSLERYAEIMGAQSAWSQEGRDIHAMLQQTFGLGAVDFSDIGAWWQAKILADYRLASRLGDLTDHYEAQYRTTSAADADLVL